MVAVHSRPDLMTRQRIAVRAEGEDVVLAVGNSELRMPYATALQVSQWLRVRAKEAKANAGDTGRHWSAIAVLSDAGK
jgi:hypothetical protein